MFRIEIEFAGNWKTVAEGFTSRNEALWALTNWKQANECTGDSFWRLVEYKP